MSGLQETFYIMGIVFMGLMFIMTIALLSAVLVIRSKINKIHDRVEERIESFTNLAERGGELSAIIGSKAFGHARKAFKKSRK